MSNTIRIKTTPNGGDKYLKVKLEQDFDFIEILSLKISQEDTYRKFCSDYGVIAGRVVVNNGFGVPNAKVSVFIPLDEIDKEDPMIKGLYPFEVITDTDEDGIRYNLLPKESETDNECYVPVGTFPTKREVLDNDTMLHIYCKYYKFTTTTNYAGDFMLFGVPLGTYTVHIDADISDIGIGSQRPYDLISQGTPSKLFDSPTKFKKEKNLNKLIQVKTLNAGVNVQPFWGDTDNCEIGITRLDFDLNYTIRPSAIFMGSIYGDQDKHSINKKCRPRKKLGLICEQMAGPGSINMIRQTIEGQIEEFDVEGGRVIDDDGTWAYQIPMNLDYMVTGEDGSLILSQDPNKGIPTRARVRFNIGMDETGGEGRLRTRARYLVPNNPQTLNEIDYSFDETTKDSSFKDLYWNKIYSVSNFISRYQKAVSLSGKVGNRSITGIKSVDECAGDKTPFPYNRVDTEMNPMFFIICLIIKIIGTLVWVMNKVLIPIINGIISVLNVILKVICNIVKGIGNAISYIPGLGHVADSDAERAQFVADNYCINKVNGACVCDDILDYVPCIYVQCPDGEAAFAPGCKKDSHGYDAAQLEQNLTYFDGDNFDHHAFDGVLPDLVGLDNCIAFEMAKALNLFHLDFYNDWVTGSLFGFLLKYKKKKSKTEKFCEYDCDDFTSDPNYTGVNGNGQNGPDNNCHTSLLLDTCINGNVNDNNWQKDSNESSDIREGLIKKVGDEFFYAATTHDLKFKLFATDIISLGSVFDCDWQGIPKIQNYLIPSSYKVPPDVEEIGDDNITREACGMVDLSDSGNDGLFFTVNCVGVHVNQRQCLNIRHICEIGVDIDEIDDSGNPSDCKIGVWDIDDGGGNYFRNVFTVLNKGIETPTSVSINGLNTNFNLGNNATYNFATTSNNGVDYVDFRGLSSDTLYNQPKHSYFLYFGLLPGKTAVDKMNQRFFTQCKTLSRENLLIQTNSTNASSNSSSNGSITFSFIGGNGVISYSIIGINGTSYGPTNGATSTSVNIIIPSLAVGDYLISGTDALGTPVSRVVTIVGPPSLYVIANKTKDCTSSTNSDGEITVSSVGGGVGPYQSQLKDSTGAIVGTYSLQSLLAPKVFNQLPTDNFGYSLEVIDSVGTSITIDGLVVNGPSSLVTNVTKVDVSCYGGNNGKITILSTGGLAPLSYNTTGPAGFNGSSNIMTSLISGTYVTTITDSSSPVSTNTVTTVINQPVKLLINNPVISELNKQCSTTQYKIPFYIAASSGIASGPVNIEYSLNNGTSWVQSIMTYVNEITPMVITLANGVIDENIKIRFTSSQNGSTCYSKLITILKTVIELPTTPLQGTIQTTNPSTGVYKHDVTGIGGIGTITGSPFNIGTTYNSSNSNTTELTDSVGCKVIL